MDFSITHHTQYDLFKISGRIDGYTSPEISEALRNLVNNGHFNVIVDMSDVTYISSSGMLVFVNIQKQLIRNKKGQIFFANVPELAFSVFELAGFDKIFNFIDDISAAASKF